MARIWVTLPLEALTLSRVQADGRWVIQCRLDNARTAPNTEATAWEQVTDHLQNVHGGVAGPDVGKLPLATREALIGLGWTPPEVEPGPDPDLTDP